MKKPSIPVPSRRAFTLIELLVVIAIIAMLAALLSPVVSKALQKSKRAACISNLRQIGIGMAQYRVDHKDRIPSRGGVWGNNGDTFWLWVDGNASYLGQLYEGDYITDYNVFYCPGQSIKKGSFFDIYGRKLFKNSNWGEVSVLSTYVQRPFLLHEKHVTWGVNVAVVACCQENTNLIPHNSNGKNVLYLDGSVRWLDGHEANNFRWDQTSTTEFWEEADES